MKKVFIGVGHGGKDPGAVANGLCEADINLVMAIAAQAELVRHGCTVLLSRYSNEDDSLEDEIREANRFVPDIAVDFHNNAGGGDGFEVYRQTNKYSTTSRDLAQCIEKEVKLTGQNSRGVKTRLNANGTDYFGFLRQINAPAVLLEGAFLDSADRYIIDTVPEQQTFGVAYAKGILAHLGVQWQPNLSCQHSGLEQENQELRAVINRQAGLLLKFKELANAV